MHPNRILVQAPSALYEHVHQSIKLLLSKSDLVSKDSIFGVCVCAVPAAAFIQMQYQIGVDRVQNAYDKNNVQKCLPLCHYQGIQHNLNTRCEVKRCNATNALQNYWIGMKRATIQLAIILRDKETNKKWRVNHILIQTMITLEYEMRILFKVSFFFSVTLGKSYLIYIPCII